MPIIKMIIPLGGDVENRIEVHCRMCGYLWPLARRWPYPKLFHLAELLPAVVHT